MHKTSLYTVQLAALLVTSALARGQFTPIALTPESYNQDVVVERTAPPPIIPVTTASMEGGLLNEGYSWYERGYHEIWVATGLPAAGSVLTSDSAFDHQYQFAPSYQSNNAVLIDSVITNATLWLATPAAYANLSFLVSSGNGNGEVNFLVYYDDGVTESGTFQCPNWMGGPGAAWTANGRVDVAAFTFDALNADNPKLFSQDVSLSHSLAKIARIELSHADGTGHNAIFAVSGAASNGDPFSPILVTGYNVDIVVESTAVRPGFLNYITTATMDNGTANTHNTWYEEGYYVPAPRTGLPAAGRIIHSEASPEHVFQMPPSYTTNNAILLDSSTTSAMVSPVLPSSYSTLSFLTASGHGPVTNSCRVDHEDGTSETKWFVAPDWLEQSPPAFTVNGRVNINTRLVDSVSAAAPRLFAVDVALANTSSPVTNLALNFAGGGMDAHAVVLAISGSSQPPVVLPRLSICLNLDGTATITSTVAGRLESATELKGAGTRWQTEGDIRGTATVNVTFSTQAKFYRVAVP